MKIFFLLIFLFFSIEAKSELLFKPLTANVFEPRVGGLVELGEKKLRLDIGTSVDLLKLSLNENEKLYFGTDFFTFTRLRSEGNFKFPVETSDYFFGINASYKTTSKSLPISTRIRIAHISSHLNDGFAHDSIFNKMPFVYSREFVNLITAIEFRQLRIYAGLEYVFSTKPKTPDPLSPELGFDFNLRLNDYFKILCGYDFKLSGIDGIFAGQNSFQAGLMIETHKDLGILLNLSGFSGRSMHGLFFNDFDSYLGLGFQVYFY